MSPAPARGEVGSAPGAHLGAVLLAAVLWGTTGTIAQQAPPGSQQALVGIATFGFGGLALLLLDARAVARLVADRSTWGLLALGAVGVIAYAALYYSSMALVGVAIGNVLALGSGPVFAAILEIVLERRRIGLGWACATAISVLGIALLAGAAQTGGAAPVGEAARVGEAGGAGGALLGIGLGLGAGFGYALYSWVAARLIARGHPSRPVMAGLFAVAAAVLLPAFALAGPGPLLGARGAAVLGYLALVPMALAYLLFGYGLRGLPASTATTLALAEPLVATALATTILHERIGVLGWAGLALIGGGILVIAADERRPRRPPDDGSP